MYQKIKRENDLREQLKKCAQIMPAVEFEEIIDGLASKDRFIILFCNFSPEYRSGYISDSGMIGVGNVSL